MTVAAPSGVVTFLFTDVEGSTRRWEADARAMRAALVVHDEVLRTANDRYDGFLFSHRDTVLAWPARSERWRLRTRLSQHTLRCGPSRTIR